MLTSNRKFGIEIEFVAPSRQAYSKIANQIRIVEDGSLRPLQFAGEYVSDVLQGDSGEESLQYACEVLKKQGAQASDPATSVHVHLDGRKKEGQLRAEKRKPEKVDGVVLAISNRLKETITIRDVTRFLLGDLDFLPAKDRYETQVIDNILYFSKAQLTRAPRLNYTYYWYEKEDRFKWLRNMLYFYTQYSEVMENIVSNSRKFGNMYCIPLGKSYNLEDIEKAKDEKELKNKVWYKGMPVGHDAVSPHYDNSRYHNVNFHSYWDRHGTVEIRSHGGTTDATKILLWVRLHQKIADKLEEMELDDIKCAGNLNKSFVEFVEEPLLQEYVKRLLGYYSGISIK